MTERNTELSETLRKLVKSNLASDVNRLYKLLIMLVSDQTVTAKKPVLDAITVLEKKPFNEDDLLSLENAVTLICISLETD